MKRRKMTLVLVAAILMLHSATMYAATDLMEIGRSPFHTPPLKSVEDLQAMFASKQDDIEKAFSMAGEADFFATFITRVKEADIEFVDFEKGSTFEWMAFKKKGQGPVRIARDVTWVNEQPFPGYVFFIDKDDMRYTFAVPAGCGNIALVGKRRVPAAASNQAPVCTMKVTPEKGYCGDTLTVDATASVDPDGGISQMTVSMLDGQGQLVDEQVIMGNALVAQTKLPCGTSTLRVTLTDNEGSQATSDACTATLTGRKRTRIIADLGYYRQPDPGDYFFGRIGAEYIINDDFSVLGLVGIAPHFKGDDGETAFLIDVLGEYSFASRFFINLGVGGWISSGDSDIDAEDSQVDAIAAIGVRLSEDPERMNTSFFLEARSAFDEMSDLKDYGRFGIGLRFRF